MVFECKKVKIFVTIPNENVEELRKAVCNAGAGIIGNYTFCTYYVKGVGSFVPNEKANPYIGKNNILEYVDEVKIEFVCDVEKLKQVLCELRKNHPYEEPAIDIVPLIDENDI